MRALLTNGSNEIVLITKHGYALRSAESNVRAMGRASRGVQGIRLGSGDELTGVAVVDEKQEMLFISEYGYGKRIKYSNFTPHGRGTKGQIAYKTNEKTGELTGVISLTKKDGIVAITSKGNAIKLRVKEIPVLGKAAAGVKIVNINSPDFVVGIARVLKE